MSQTDNDARRRAERARRVALFRYELIQEVIDPTLTARQRGKLVRELAERAHPGPFAEPVQVTRHTIDRWVRAWRVGGFEALVPQPAKVTARTPPEVLATAAALKRENPGRTAAQITRILRAQSGWAPNERTLQRHFERLELGLIVDEAGHEQRLTAAPAAFGRFEADRPDELWVGDALHGPQIAGHKVYLFAFLDDRSRAVMAARFGFSEDTVRLAAALRPALASRGVPESIYVDNGSAFVDSWLLRGCASLGIKLVHSTPGRPQGRGKIERFFRTVREQFLVEITPDRAAEIADLAELNRLFTAWVETEYHPRTHSETAGSRRWRAGSTGWLPRCRGPPPRSCARRSCGPSTAPWPRRPRSRCTATPTRSTNCWSGARSSWCSTRSISPNWWCAIPGASSGPRSPTTSGATPTPRPAPKSPTPPWNRPGSTTYG